MITLFFCFIGLLFSQFHELCTTGPFKYVQTLSEHFISLQSELENLSFMYTNPQDYAKVKRRVSELRKEQEKEIEEVLYS